MIVLDTHALLWWVSGSPRLSRRARGAIRKAVKAGPAVVSVMSVFEIATIARRGRLDVGDSLNQWLSDLLVLPEVRFEPVGVTIARRAADLPDAVSGDPSDRIIAATALELGARLVTADRRLGTIPGLEVVW